MQKQLQIKELKKKEECLKLKSPIKVRKLKSEPCIIVANPPIGTPNKSSRKKKR